MGIMCVWALMVQTAALAGSWLWAPINPAIAIPLEEPSVFIAASPASAAALMISELVSGPECSKS